jgi:hypothetical protein
MKRILVGIAVLCAVVGIGVAAALGGFASSASPSAARNDSPQQQQLKVHGAWTIEVRDRAGRIVARRHVENALTFGGEVALIRILAHGTFGPWGIGLLSSGTSPCVKGGNLNEGCFVFEPTMATNGLRQSFFPDSALNLAVSTNINPLNVEFRGTINAARDGTINRVESRVCYAVTEVPQSQCGSGDNFTATDIPPVTVAAGQQILADVKISFS